MAAVAPRAPAFHVVRARIVEGHALVQDVRFRRGAVSVQADAERVGVASRAAALTQAVLRSPSPGRKTAPTVPHEAKMVPRRPATREAVRLARQAASSQVGSRQHAQGLDPSVAVAPDGAREAFRPAVTVRSVLSGIALQAATVPSVLVQKAATGPRSAPALRVETALRSVRDPKAATALRSVRDPKAATAPSALAPRVAVTVPHSVRVPKVATAPSVLALRVATGPRSVRDPKVATVHSAPAPRVAIVPRSVRVLRVATVHSALVLRVATVPPSVPALRVVIARPSVHVPRAATAHPFVRVPKGVDFGPERVALRTVVVLGDRHPALAAAAQVARIVRVLVGRVQAVRPSAADLVPGGLREGVIVREAVQVREAVFAPPSAARVSPSIAPIVLLASVPRMRHEFVSLGQNPPGCSHRRPSGRR